MLIVITLIFQICIIHNKIKDIKENVKEIILYIDPKANPFMVFDKHCNGYKFYN